MKILIVDDDHVDRRLIRRTLGLEAGALHDCAEASSVAEGLEALEATQFDVILLDYRMPGTNGIEFILEMRARPKLRGAAIIMVSTEDNPDVALECIEAGAQDFLPKSDVTLPKLSKCILHARKRYEIEQEMHKSYQAVKRMAEKDALTGLSNRFHFEEVLRVMTASSRRAGDSVALLALDLDNFKHVNDTLGHAVGDLVLQEVVRRIAACLRNNEGFARLGGDEFAVILGGIRSPEEVSAIANRIVEQFKGPLLIEDAEVFCGLSVGVALYPVDADEPHELLKCADIAMYRAKQGEQSKICFYEDRYQAEFKRRATIKNEMNRFLKDSQFRLFYQPIVEAGSARIVGVEALVRWPDRSPVYYPDEFIPIAEESRLIDPLGRWIARTAVQQLASWHQSGFPSLYMSLNISPVQLLGGEFTEFLIRELGESAVETSAVTLEVTETTLFKDDNKIQSELTTLSNNGFGVALDDFGMGFSSIAHLMRHPVNAVKLDRSMQMDVFSDHRRRQMLEGLTLMLQKLDFQIVAEGVESEEQRALCEILGIHRLQGYLFGKPMSAGEMTARLRRAMP